MFGNLQQQGFNTALNAAQNQQNIQSGLAGQGFGFGQAIQNQQWQQGEAARALNQALIDAAKGQYGGFTGSPANALNTMIGATSAGNMGQNTTTQTQKKGLFDYITAIASL